MKKIDTIQLNEQKRQKLADTAASAVSVITNTIKQLSLVNSEIDNEISIITNQENALAEIKKQYEEAKQHNIKVIDKFRDFIEV